MALYVIELDGMNEFCCSVGQLATVFSVSTLFSDVRKGRVR
jgi:hypothetical protein